MVAAPKTRRVVCTIVRVPADSPAETSAADRGLRPSELLPWADPYIAGLVTQLQDEVRREQRRAVLAKARERRQAGGTGAWPKADLDPPSPQTDLDWSREDDGPHRHW
jgi:hypothetical protein